MSALWVSPQAQQAPRYTGSFMSMPFFDKLEIQRGAPIFKVDTGFMAQTTEGQLRERMLKWVDDSFRRPVPYAPIGTNDDKNVRIIIQDAERTFFALEHRRKLHEFLYAMSLDLGGYKQSMSFVAAVCLLALTEEETACVLRKVAKVIPNHWKPDGFAVNAGVVAHYFKQHHPEVAARFCNMRLPPGAYVSEKTVTSLCVNVLTLPQAVRFIDNAMAQGFLWLLKFQLAIVQHLKSRLLADTDLLALMRLDNVDGKDKECILAIAEAMNLDNVGGDLPMLRERAHDELLSFAQAPRSAVLGTGRALAQAAADPRTAQHMGQRGVAFGDGRGNRRDDLPVPNAYVALRTVSPDVPLLHLFHFLECWGSVQTIRRNIRDAEIVTAQYSSPEEAEACALALRGGEYFFGRRMCAQHFRSYSPRHKAPAEEGDPSSAAITSYRFARCPHKAPEWRNSHMAPTSVVALGCLSPHVDAAAVNAYLHATGLAFRSINWDRGNGWFAIRFTNAASAVRFVALAQFAACGEPTAQVKFLR